MHRYKELSKAEDFYYRDADGLLQTAEKVVMFGGENQALLDCYGIWAVVNVDAILLPKEVSQEELLAYYERESSS